MTRHLMRIACTGLLVLGLVTACSNRPQVTMPKGTYPLPGEPESSTGSPKRQPQPATQEAPKEKGPASDKIAPDAPSPEKK